MSDDTTIEERIKQLQSAKRLTGAPELRAEELEERQKKLDEALKLRVAEGKGGDVIRGRFVEVVQAEDTQWVVLDPNDGRKQIRLETPGFDDIYLRSAPEIAKAYEETEHTYVSDEAVRVEARAVISPRGNVVWDVEPLSEKKLSEPVRASEVVRDFDRKVLPELEQTRDDVQSARIKLGLQRIERESGATYEYPRKAGMKDIVHHARAVAGGEAYEKAWKELATVQKDDALVQRNLRTLKREIEQSQGQPAPIKSQNSAELERLQKMSTALEKQALEVTEEYKRVVKGIDPEAFKKAFIKTYEAEMKKQEARQQLDRRFHQTTVKILAAEQSQREFRALGSEVVEVERTQSGQFVPSSRKQFNKMLSEVRKLGEVKAKEKVMMPNPGKKLERSVA